METTRKYPRTLEDAFGPYARGPVESPSSDSVGHTVVEWLVYILAIVLIGALAVGGL
jgi:hypothetical protein